MAKTIRRVTVHPISLRELRVLRIEDLTSGMRRVTLGGDELGAFTSSNGLSQPPLRSDGFDDDVRLILPYPGRPEPVLPIQEEGHVDWPKDPRPISRVYTVRRWDPERGELDVDFVKHGTGIATVWAYRARPGDRIHVAGPAASRDLPRADWLLVVGDDTALPAIARLLEEASPKTRVDRSSSRSRRTSTAFRCASSRTSPSPGSHATVPPRAARPCWSTPSPRPRGPTARCSPGSLGSPPWSRPPAGSWCRNEPCPRTTSSSPATGVSVRSSRSTTTRSSPIRSATRRRSRSCTSWPSCCLRWPSVPRSTSDWPSSSRRACGTPPSWPPRSVPIRPASRSCCATCRPSRWFDPRPTVATSSPMRVAISPTTSSSTSCTATATTGAASVRSSVSKTRCAPGGRATRRPPARTSRACWSRSGTSTRCSGCGPTTGATSPSRSLPCRCGRTSVR